MLKSSVVLGRLSDFYNKLICMDGVLGSVICFVRKWNDNREKQPRKRLKLTFTFKNAFGR